jgi:hypothetical protein
MYESEPLAPFCRNPDNAITQCTCNLQPTWCYYVHCLQPINMVSLRTLAAADQCSLPTKFLSQSVVSDCYLFIDLLEPPWPCGASMFQEAMLIVPFGNHLC